MAIQWMDNFGSYGTNSGLMLNGPYAEIYGTLVTDPDPNVAGSTVYRTGGQFSSGQSPSLRRVLSATQTTVGMAFRIWLASLPSSTSISKSFLIADGSNAALTYMIITTTGGIQVKNSGGTLLAESSGPVIVANAWQHVEIKVVHSATVGTVEVRVDGVTVATATGLNTGAGPAAQVRIDNWSDGGSAGITGYVKDFIVWDGSGSSNTSFLGSCSVITLAPSSDVSLNWTPSSGSTGWNLINETNPDDDTNYIQAPNPAPSPAVFGLTNLPANVTSVKGLMTLIRSKKTDGGDAQLQASLVSGASTSAGTDRAITTAYTYWSDLFPLDPATSAAWTPSAVDAANLKLNRTV